jgi:NADH:ubiquinone oxidoreductase subunit E
MAAEPTTAELRALVAEFEPGKGHVMPALHKVQDTYGYITREAIEAVAEQLNTTPALVYGCVSFYDDFRTHPAARTEVSWCSGPACRLKGGDQIRAAMQQTLGVSLGGQSEDHEVGFHLGQCIGTCSEAPQVWVNGKVVGDLTVAKAIRLARELKGAK